MAPTTFARGSLSFKGDKTKKKKKNKHKTKAKEETEEVLVPADTTADLTAAEQKALRRRKEREEIELRKVAGKSHRERVEEFNEKLGSQTELNDIPRVSAAGNG